MHRKLIALLIFLAIIALPFLAAQEEAPDDGALRPQNKINQRSLGDQNFAIALGVFLPLFTHLLDDLPNYPVGNYPTKIQVGGLGSLIYSFYLTPEIKLGLSIAGNFSRDINKNPLYMLPILVRASYEFHPWGRISIPLSLALGTNFTFWKETTTTNFIIQPGLGVYFDWNAEWSFGLNINYWLIPQLGSPGRRSLGNFMDITLAAEYHF